MGANASFSADDVREPGPRPQHSANRGMPSTTAAGQQDQLPGLLPATCRAMGNCMSGAAVSVHRRLSRPSPTTYASHIPDTSKIELEDLLRLGLGEVHQAARARMSFEHLRHRNGVYHATVARKGMEHLQHLCMARALLSDALRRCGRVHPDLRTHLTAVLEKLSEEATTMEAMLAKKNVTTPDQIAASAIIGSTTPEVGGLSCSPVSDTHSEHSSEIGPEGPIWDYGELREGFLNLDSENETDSSSPSGSVAVTLQGVDLAVDSALNSGMETREPPSQRSHPASATLLRPVEENNNEEHMDGSNSSSGSSSSGSSNGEDATRDCGGSTSAGIASTPIDTASKQEAQECSVAEAVTMQARG
eukprot:CAMPEP_0172833730 /NCGR_PEP_ID=MMETSP1075-20121228/24564_1 /TAXON_ID=2916 /ORGANISM="Ceratium fusus, Strain PA161109" /LENGTH=360 /DNA_ID=CAMNT_0013676519 /DNA_START=26 /DNA_END=1105 /DNA_ORIENTATION=-